MSNVGRSLRPPGHGAGSTVLSRRVLLKATAGGVAGVAAAGLGWLAANSRNNRWRESARRLRGSLLPAESKTLAWQQLEVTGASMMPTLLGRHIVVECGACGVSWAACGDFTARRPAPVVCWNCGSAIDLAGASVRAGATVRLLPQPAAEMLYAVGEMVAVRWPPATDKELHPAQPSFPIASAATLPSAPDDIDSLSVKRVAAVPGQLVTHRDGELLVDGESILPDRIWLPVHDDTHRRSGESWWKTQFDHTVTSISSLATGFQLRAPFNPDGLQPQPASDWLVYHHHSVHNGMRPDAVRDDVPSNVTEIRALGPVSRLRLTCHAEVSQPGMLEVAFWDGAGVVIRSQRLTQQTTHVEIRGPQMRRAALAERGDATIGSAEEVTPAPSTFPDLSEQRPIAVRIRGGAVEIGQLRIERPVEYRIDPRVADQRHWPARMGENEYFLLGDNIPFSLDSRHFGPVPATRIVGRIEPVEYDEPGR